MRDRPAQQAGLPLEIIGVQTQLAVQSRVMRGIGQRLALARTDFVTVGQQHRAGLDILVHPLTDDMVDDHTVYALWLGSPVTLKLDTMQRRGYSAALLPAA